MYKQYRVYHECLFTQFQCQKTGSYIKVRSFEFKFDLFFQLFLLARQVQNIRSVFEQIRKNVCETSPNKLHSFIKPTRRRLILESMKTLLNKFLKLQNSTKTLKSKLSVKLTQLLFISLLESQENRSMIQDQDLLLRNYQTV